MNARSTGLASDSLPAAAPGPALDGPGWRGARGEPSLGGMFASVRTAKGGSFWRRLLAFLGPGYLVAVGYMDPGNWATSLAGGSKFGYALLTIALISNVMAILLQALCARLGIGAGRDLAQACRDAFPRSASWPLWVVTEIAICATDLAEVIGTTVMPHNLFLHSGVLQTRQFGESVEEKREAITLATVDSTIALMFALLINAAILILAAATFNKTGQTEVAELGEVHKLIAPLLGSAWAPTLFGIALLCCGLNSTVTATLAGQIVMEGFIDIRLPPWARRLVTRSIAIIPAAGVTIWYGQAGTAKLLILSQVILGLALPFAIVPLVMFTADRAKMGELVAPRWLTWASALIAAVLIALNIKLLYDLIPG